LLRKSNSATKIWVLDHNFTLWGRAIGELSDLKAAEFIDGIAWHGYAGLPSAMTTVHDAFPLKHAYFTEGGPQREPHVSGTPFPDPWTAWSGWAQWANDVVRNWARSITVWNLALDENGTPYIGIREQGDVLPGQSLAGHGLIQIDSKTREVTRTGRFWAMTHYTRHVRRGAKVFRTNGLGDGEVSHAGFRNPDGSFVVVLANRGAEKRVQLVMGEKALNVDLKADSVHTLQWS
jgi:glucosylceramidase